ncbi:MAG: hypothetical protein ACI841_002104 [Planctomycetota bacterium]|jgi:uncharacterized protein YqeY
MGMRETLDNDVKDAMRAGDTLKRDTLRMVLSQVKNKRIELGEELTDDQVMAVLQSSVKSRRDSATQYRAGDRLDLAEKEEAEIAMIEGYLPQRLSQDEVAEIVRTKIDELGISSKRDIGKLMKAVMAEHRGRVDGGMVQKAAGSMLD